MCYMGQQLIRGGTCLTPDSESHKDSDLIQILKRVPPGVFMVLMFGHLSQKWTFLLPKAPDIGPLLYYVKVCFQHNRQPPTCQYGMY